MPGSSRGRAPHPARRRRKAGRGPSTTTTQPVGMPGRGCVGQRCGARPNLGGVTQTSLGMPAMPPPTTAPTWKQAWDAGFVRRAGVLPARVPRRPLPYVGPRVAAVGAGAAAAVPRDQARHGRRRRGRPGRAAPAAARPRSTLTLLGVEVAARPADLPTASPGRRCCPPRSTGWCSPTSGSTTSPAMSWRWPRTALVRVVHVAADGTESLGARVDDHSVPPSLTSCARVVAADGPGSAPRSAPPATAPGPTS